MRKNRATKREILPDPLFNSTLIAKLINVIMWEGKKVLAQKILYSAFEKVEQKTKKSAMEVFQAALENIMPVVELKVRRIAGSNYQVPVETTPERKLELGLRWLVLYSRARNEKTMFERLAGEIVDAFNGIGGSVKKKDDTHKMAEANKAFAHLRF
ncbi:MAG: 30S ribosomal protein S7 [Mycoplasmataceae bacterium]|nr:30S ribosomal protein S7 [Mycoplasmataceae bacterium]